MVNFPLIGRDMSGMTPDSLFEEIRSAIDVDYWSACHVPRLNRPRFDLGSEDLWFRYPQGWQDHYAERMLHEIDPVPRYAPRTSFASCWHDLARRFCRTGACRDFFAAAEDHDIGAGVCMAARQVNGDMQIISFARRRKTAFSENDLVTATYFGQIMGRLIGCRAGREDGPEPDISPRALECLELCALGKTSSEIEGILGISRHTVDFHIRNAMTALDSSSRTYAVVRAVQMGLLTPA